MSKFKEFMAKVKANPKDAEALWGLYHCYRLGERFGGPKDDNLANLYLTKAADAGYKDAQLELTRRTQTQAVTQMFAQQDDRDLQHAKRMFKDREGLEDAVVAKILPTLVRLKMPNGEGTGFFQFSDWLVSNAHVISCSEELAITHVVDAQGVKRTLEATRAFYRPADNDAAPDLVILQSNTRDAGNQLCLATQFSGDKGYKNAYTFYYDLSDKKIKYLKHCSQSGVFPIIYLHEDETMPMPGSSGSPIIEARVVLGKTPCWQFRVVSVLYARCSPVWHNSQVEKSEYVSEDTKLVCAIPVMQEFQKIRKILMSEETAKRASQMAAAAAALGDARGKADAKKYSHMKELNIELVRLGLKEFEEGETELNIDLPDGLEKLWYQGIVSVNQSLMIRAVFEREIPRKSRDKFSNVPDIEEAALVDDVDAFIRDIAQEPKIVLKHGNGICHSSKGYFRIDIAGGKDEKVEKKSWMLQVQDNTGKDQSGRPYHEGKKPLSSIFAIVKLLGCTEIEGRYLAKLIRLSQDEKKEKDLSFLNFKPDKPDAHTAGKKNRSRGFFADGAAAAEEGHAQGDQKIFGVLNAYFPAHTGIHVDNDTYTPLLQDGAGQEKFFAGIATALDRQQTSLFLINTTRGAVAGTHWIGMVMKFDDEVGACIELFDSASDGEHYDDNYEGALDTFANDNPHCIGRPITDIVILLQGKFAQQGINIKIFRTYQQAGDSNCGIWVIDNLQQRTYADPLRGNMERLDLPPGLEAIDIQEAAKEWQTGLFSYKKR